MDAEREATSLLAPAPAASRAVTWLVDNAEAYRELVAVCGAARESIWVTQLAFDADCQAWLPEVRLADVLLDAAASRAVDVRILLNASLLLDTAAPLRRHFAAAGADPARLRVRGISRFPQLLHAKVVVVDARVAFLVGSPFANGYWDDSAHAPTDTRRPARELGGRPLHDLTVRLEGPACDALAAVFTELWNGADDLEPGDDGTLPPAPATACDDDAVRIACSAPRPRRAGHPAERREILPMLRRGIEEAERLIYIEHQYLSSVAVIESLVSALERAPRLEVIVILNQNPDVTAYRGWQNRRLASSGLASHPRVGLFSLWTLAPREDEGAELNQVFIHSKVVAVDDRWAMVGSANLDGVSLATYGEDFSGWLGRRVFRGVRNFDVAAVVTGAGESDNAVLELRTALWREHLDAPDLDGAAEPAGGWLAHWRRVAARNVALVSRTAEGEPPRQLLVLPHSRASTPVAQLRDIGVRWPVAGLDVCFDPSWMEVHLSPNWVRNMFS